MTTTGIPYATRKILRQTLGVAAEAVLDVLAYHDTGAGVEITHDTLAAEAGITRSTTRRTIEALCEAGWVKRDPQIRGQRQIANRYQVVLGEQGVQGEQGAHSEQAPYVFTTDVDKTYLVDNQVLPEEEHGYTRRGGGAEAPPDHIDLHQVVDQVDDDLADTPTDLGATQDLGRRHRPRVVRFAHLGPDNFITRPYLIDHIVETFKDRVEKATGRRVIKSRIKGFSTTARILLEEHRSLQDILAVIEFVADHGLLADSAEDAQLTNLKEVRDDFDFYLESSKTTVADIPSTGGNLSVLYLDNPEIAEVRANLRQLLENHA